MSDRNKARILCICIGLMLGALTVAAVGCGTVTMRYDSSGKHPDTRK